MRSSSLNIIDLLKQTINDISQNIHDYIDDDQAFTRQRKLSCQTTIKIVLNKVYPSIDKKLVDVLAPDKHVSPAAFVQQKINCP